MHLRAHPANMYCDTLSGVRGRCLAPMRFAVLAFSKLARLAGRKGTRRAGWSEIVGRDNPISDQGQN